MQGEGDLTDKARLIFPERFNKACKLLRKESSHGIRGRIFSQVNN